MKFVYWIDKVWNKLEIQQLSSPEQKYIQSLFQLRNNKKPLISGYLGHVFFIRFLRNFFPVVFAYRR